MRRSLTFLATLVLLTGCLGDVPTSGPIQAGLANNGRDEQNFVRTIVVPPVPGADPVGIVRGFFAAAAAGEPDFATARLFLTQKAQQEWNPVGDRRIISDRSQVWEYDGVRSPGLVTMRASLSGSLSVNGEYVQQSGERKEQFRLQLVDREWRIASLPAGITMTRSDLTRTYRQVMLYFPDQLKRYLIPQSLFVPIRPGLPTSLVRALLAGPVGWLAPSLSTGFPSGSALTVDAVALEQGTAVVALNATAATASSTDRALMAAQLTYSLQQLPEFRSLSLTAAGERIEVPSENISSFSLKPSTSGDLFFIGDKGISRATNNLKDVNSISFNAPADAAKSFRAPLANAKTSQLLAIDDAGTLVASDVVRTSAGIAATGFNPILRPPSQLLPPQWDQAGGYWLMGRGKEPALVTARGTRFPAKVSLPELGQIESFAIARDGVRLLVGTRIGKISSLQILRIVRKGSSVRAEAPRTVWQSRSAMTDMEASDVDEISILVGGNQLFVLNLTSLAISGPTSVPASVSLAAHPGEAPVVETTDHRLLVLRAGKWIQFTTGKDPSYAG